MSSSHNTKSGTFAAYATDWKPQQDRLSSQRRAAFLRGDENRKLCSLYLSIMDRMGVKLDSFGDASTRLQGL